MTTEQLNKVRQCLKRLELIKSDVERAEGTHKENQERLGNLDALMRNNKRTTHRLIEEVEEIKYAKA